MENTEECKAGYVKSMVKRFDSLAKEKCTIPETVEKLHSSMVSSEKKLPSLEEVNDIFTDVQRIQPPISELLSPCDIDEFRKRQRDLNRKDLCIIIAGETSGGKSTLVNRLVGKKIFRTGVGETTATICRIRNSNDPKNITCRVVGKNDRTIDERSFKSGQDKEMLEYLEWVENNSQNGSVDIDHVDVSLYVPFLKGNTMIVDTPGIGGSLELSEKMMKYLPNAVSFIFVSNVCNAGGVQSDRLVKIIQEVVRLHNENDITCFDPRSALFISNKWDTVHKSEREDAWKLVQKELKKHWPVLSFENIFRTALRSAKDSEEGFAKEFERFEEKLTDVVERSQYSRQINNLNFLKTMLDHVDVKVKGSLHLISMSTAKRKETMKKLKSEVLKLRKDMEGTKVSINCHISKTLLDLSRMLLEELKSIKVKERILNPPGKRKIISVPICEVNNKVEERILAYISNWMKGKTVTEGITIVHKTIEDQFSNFQETIRAIERDFIGSEKLLKHEGHSFLKSDTPILIGILASAPLWIPILAAAGVLCVVAGFVLSPKVPRMVNQWLNGEIKLNIIDVAYEDFVRQYSVENIQKELEIRFGRHYRQLVDRLFAKTTEKQISNLIGTIKKLSNECACSSNQETKFKQLSHKIDAIKNHCARYHGNAECIFEL